MSADTLPVPVHTAINTTPRKLTVPATSEPSVQRNILSNDTGHNGSLDREKNIGLQHQT